jgi:hypothetical protein
MNQCRPLLKGVQVSTKTDRRASKMNMTVTSVATAITDVFQKNAISVGNKYLKILKIFGNIDEVKKTGGSFKRPK